MDFAKKIEAVLDLRPHDLATLDMDALAAGLRDILTDRAFDEMDLETTAAR